MNINPTSGSGPVFRTASPPPAVSRGRSSGRDEADFSQATALNSAMAQSPASRTTEVQRARDLIGDVNYPPKETIARLSHLLAMKWPASDDMNSTRSAV